MDIAERDFVRRPSPTSCQNAACASMEHGRSPHCPHWRNASATQPPGQGEGGTWAFSLQYANIDDHAIAQFNDHGGWNVPSEFIQ
jgi:hypothetical protein